MVVLCPFFTSLLSTTNAIEAVAAMKFMETTKMLNKLQTKTKSETEDSSEIEGPVFGRKLGLITRLIGCSHKNISRPFVEREIGYKSCLNCGARKHFDAETFESNGKFYYPPVNQL